MNRLDFAEWMKRIQIEKAALRECVKGLTPVVVAMIEIAPQEDESGEDAEFRGELCKLVARSKAALDDASTPWMAPCMVCGVEIAVVCDSCFDDVKEEITRRHSQP